MHRTRRHLLGLGLTGCLLLTAAGCGTSSTSASRADDDPAALDSEPVASFRLRPRSTTTTVRRTTTTTVRPTTTTTVRPTTTVAPPTTVRPTTTTVRSTTTAPPTTVAPTTTAAPPTTAAPTTTAPVGGLASSVLNELLGLVNAKRATGTTCGGVPMPAVPALSLQVQLGAAAQLHAADMAAKNYFSHTGADGSSAGTRITRAGYRWTAWAENIAAGQPSAASVISGWFGSDGHCRNFMSPNVTQIGFGRADNPAATYRTYWVADLARP